MKKKSLPVLLFLLCTIGFVHSQPTNTGWANSHLPQFYTPQVADMMRYDRTPVPLCSGMVDLSIPLVEFNDPDFDFPISIQYVSDGFKPSKADNFVGHDWILQCGGIVYREINGIADDLESKFMVLENGQSQSVGGFLHMARTYKGALNQHTVEQEIGPNPYKYSKVYGAELIPIIPEIKDKKGKNVESFPDLYHFSFGSYSGTFVINFDGTVTALCENGDKVKVNLSEYTLLANGTRNLTQRIWISTDDGYQYCFGGSYGAVEYTARSWRETASENHALWSQQLPQITAYHLTRIVAPNGRMLDIEYLDKIPGEYHSGETYISPHTTANELYAKGAQINYSFSCQISSLSQQLSSVNSGEPRTGVAYKTFILNKAALVSSIITDTQRFSFKYSNTNAQAKPSFNGDFFMACGAKLDAIEYYKGNRRQETKFTYEYVGGGSQRLFLKSVQTPQEGIYSFRYNLRNYTLPEYASHDLDHCGYWRGPAGTGTKLIPGFSKGPNTSYYHLTVNSECRNPTGIGQDCAMLQEVIFPTGGRVEFTYEPHKYFRWLEMEMWNGRMERSLKAVSNLTGEFAGGVRLKSRKYYDSSKVVKYIRYKYDFDDGMCSGTLYDKPFYHYLIHNKSYMDQGNYYSEIAFINFKSDGYKFDQSDVDKQHVQYSQVTEQFIENYSDTGQIENGNPSGSYTVYKFLDYIMNPDQNLPLQTKYFSTSGLPIVPVGSPDWFYNSSLICDGRESHSKERGRIWNESYYSSDGTLKKSITNRFERIYGDNYLLLLNTFSNLSDDQTQRATALCNRRPYSYVPFLTITSAYEDGQVLTDSLQYGYDSKGYLKTKTDKRAQKDILNTSYTYAHEYPYEPYVSMTANHLSPLVEEENSYISIDKIISSLPSYQYNYKYDSPYSFNGVFLSNNALVESVVRTDTGEQTMRIPEHDSYGNPLYVIEKESIHTVYLWSYSGKYPVAKIENATYDQVRSVLSVTPGNLSKMDAPDMERINGLRSALPDAQVTTYTYKQNLGITSVTDPSGATTWYDYDQAGRLSEVYQIIRGVKTVLRGNKYHIVNY